MTTGIYGYRDKLKDKIVYIGQSVNIEERLVAHMKPSQYSTQRINSVLQTNPDRYCVHILKECDVEDLDYWEVTLISLFNPKHNHDAGGKVLRGVENHMYGKHLSEEAKDKLSKAMSSENNPMYGKQHSLDSKMKMSKSNNKTGFFRVSKCKDKKYKQGFSYRYSYVKDGKRKDIRSNEIAKLESKVKSKGLPWLIMNEVLARQTKGVLSL